MNKWMDLYDRIYINKKISLNEGQGHKVKGQGQIYSYGENVSLLGLSGNVYQIVMFQLHCHSLTKILRYIRGHEL